MISVSIQLAAAALLCSSVVKAYDYLGCVDISNDADTQDALTPNGITECQSNCNSHSYHYFALSDQ
jgi:hypothetical protein